MDIRDLKFPSVQVASAADMTHVNFRAQLNRNWKIVGHGQAAGPDRKGHVFSIYDALGYALAHRLVRMGAPSTLAFELAMLDCVYDGLIEPLLQEQGAQAAWFIYYPWVDRRESSLVLIGPRSHVAAFFEDFRGENAVIIDLFGLRNQVFASLGVTLEGES